MKQIRIVVAATKGFDHYKVLSTHLDKYIEELSPVYRDTIEIVTGSGRGICPIIERYSKDKGYEFREFEAFWDTDGNRAGYFRNNAMIKHASKGIGVLFIFWDGKSTSVKNLVELAQRYGVDVEVVRY